MMKKILSVSLIGLCALFMMACADDVKYNTNESTVRFGQTEYTVKENKGFFTIPVMATGERNGVVEVDVEIVSLSANCVEDEHYIVTSKHVVIPANKTSVNVEVKTVDDRVINEDRKFGLKISHVKGAVSVDPAYASIAVTLLDNDNIPYDRMGGTWTVTATNMITDSGEASEPVSWETQLITVVDEEEEGYGSLLTMSPWRMWNGDTFEGQLDIKHTLSFHYNASSQTATLNLKLGEVMASGFALGGEDEDGLNLSDCTLLSATPTSVNYTLNGTLIGTVNAEFNKITFNLPLMGLLVDANNTPFSYWFYYTNIEMTRK